jgi:predicted Zn-dependent protease with MMP-like domain
MFIAMSIPNNYRNRTENITMKIDDYENKMFNCG